jgi:alkylation response protein AidB-like acyl-CoA dehydrogenase
MTTAGAASITAASSDTEIIEHVRAWLAGALPEEWIRAVQEEDSETIRVLRDATDEGHWFERLGTAGLATPSFPAQYGGLGLTPRQARLVTAQLSRHKTPRFRNLIGVNLAGPAILQWGTEQQKAQRLTEIGTHREIWCQLFSEPGAGSDLAGLATRAVRADDGWIINGSKIWSSMAHYAQWGFLLTRSDIDAPKHQGITVFMLNLDAAGITMRPLRHLTGDHEFNQVFFDDVFIPDDQRIGPVNGGWKVAQSVLMNERVSGSGEGATLPGTRTGRSVASVIEHYSPVQDPALRQRLAQAWLDETLIDFTNRRTTAMRRAGEPTGPQGSLSKLFSSEFRQRLHDLLLDLDGFDSVAWSAGDRWRRNSAWSFLRVRSGTIAGGTSEVQRSIIGERLLGLPKEPGLPASTPWKDIPRS